MQQQQQQQLDFPPDVGVAAHQQQPLAPTGTRSKTSALSASSSSSKSLEPNSTITSHRDTFDDSSYAESCTASHKEPPARGMHQQGSEPHRNEPMVDPYSSMAQLVPKFDPYTASHTGPSADSYTATTTHQRGSNNAESFAAVYHEAEGESRAQKPASNTSELMVDAAWR